MVEFSPQIFAHDVYASVVMNYFMHIRLGPGPGSIEQAGGIDVNALLFDNLFYSSTCRSGICKTRLDRIGMTGSDWIVSFFSDTIRSNMIKI